MILTRLIFECFQDTTLTAAERAISGLITELKYNGQIIGNEFPCLLKDGHFVTQALCPTEDALMHSNNNKAVNRALNALIDAGLLKPKVDVLGQELHSDMSDPEHTPSWQILYTSYVQTCSPLRCGEHFAPIPLYHQPKLANGCYKQLINWQQDWQACDQLQMNGRSAEFSSLKEIGDCDSSLSKRGLAIARQLEEHSGIATYYYLYRVGGESKQSEQQRRCPSCHGDWALAEPIHQVFDFKCDDCRLVSNLSWDYN